MPDDPTEQRLEAWAASPAGSLPPGLERRLHDALAGSLTPVRALPSPRALALGFFAVFVVLVAAVIAILKVAGVRFMADAQSACMIAMFTGAGFLFCLDVVRRMIPGSRLKIPPLAVVVLSAGAAIAGLTLLFPWGKAGAVAMEGWRCAALELAIALPAAAVFWFLARRGALFLSSGLGVALGGVAVFVALAPVQLQCMFPQAPHLLIWHVGPAAILIGCGALAVNLARR